MSITVKYYGVWKESHKEPLRSVSNRTILRVRSLEPRLIIIMESALLELPIPSQPLMPML
jgi:hypothetical protein